MARYNLAQIQDLLRQAGWAENLIAKYAAIVYYESSGNTDLVGDNGTSYGLLQIHNNHTDFDFSRYRDPIYNLSYAYRVYRREGDHAWWTSVHTKWAIDKWGVRSRSEEIYNAGGGQSQIISANEIMPLVATYNDIAPDNGNQDQSSNFVLYAALGLLGIVVLTRY